MFDAEGNINSANRSAEALFGYDGDELARRNLAELFAPESRHGVFEYLASLKASDAASLLDHGREMLGRERKGGMIPLSMTMGRTRADGPNFFAVFRDLSQARQTESELREARRLAERATSAKADVLARISHEVRTPLNAIIGFAEVMTGERFGALGNERYREYMKDIRASGERVIAIINDLLDLSRIETGKLDLAFTNQNLNEMVESCVAVMQPQANRERIIIRTSLAHTLPLVLADARALRQITLNLIGNSIHLANAGGQVIVSTALSDFGEVMLRVRDTGHGLNDNEVAAALEPFRTHGALGSIGKLGRQPVADQGPGRSQPRQIPDQDRRPFRHADRGGISARGGAGLTARPRCDMCVALDEAATQARFLLESRLVRMHFSRIAFLLSILGISLDHALPRRSQICIIHCRSSTAARGCAGIRRRHFRRRRARHRIDGRFPRPDRGGEIPDAAVGSRASSSARAITTSTSAAPRAKRSRAGSAKSANSALPATATAS